MLSGVRVARRYPMERPDATQCGEGATKLELGVTEDGHLSLDGQAVPGSRASRLGESGLYAHLGDSEVAQEVLQLTVDAVFRYFRALYLLFRSDAEEFDLEPRFLRDPLHTEGRYALTF